jgi:hypothetical protein
MDLGTAEGGATVPPERKMSPFGKKSLCQVLNLFFFITLLGRGRRGATVSL